MKNKNSKPAKKTVNRGVGRPKAEVKVPGRKFTFADLCEANGVNTETGKGKMTNLTLRKFLARDMYHTKLNAKGLPVPDRTKPRRNSVIVLLDEVREPASTDGLGRKCEVYQLRAKRDAAKLAAKTATAKPTPAPVSVNVGTDATPAPVAPVAPVIAEVITAPEVPAVAEVAAPVAETAAVTA